MEIVLGDQVHNPTAVRKKSRLGNARTDQCGFYAQKEPRIIINN
jgi:hypothetical protein